MFSNLDVLIRDHYNIFLIVVVVVLLTPVH